MQVNGESCRDGGGGGGGGNGGRGWEGTHFIDILNTKVQEVVDILGKLCSRLGIMRRWYLSMRLRALQLVPTMEVQKRDLGCSARP